MIQDYLTCILTYKVKKKCLPLIISLKSNRLSEIKMKVMQCLDVHIHIYYVFSIYSHTWLL